MPIVLLDPPLVDPTLTVETLVGEVYTHLEPSSFGYLNRLAEPVENVAQDTFVFEFNVQAAIKPGAYLGVDLEVVYVWDYDQATKRATVQRAMLGSVAAAHDAGALVQIQPRVSRFDVVKQLRHDIRSWPAALYVVDVVDFEQSTLVRAYDFDVPAFTRILDVLSLDPSGTWHRAPGWRFEPSADTTDFPSGRAIVFPSASTGRQVRVIYARPFDTSSFGLSTTLASIGLTDSMLDIPVLGAAARLVREAPRTDTRAQGQSRLAEEVPPMHLMNTSKDLTRRRDDRIHQEIARLRELFPQRRG